MIHKRQLNSLGKGISFHQHSKKTSWWVLLAFFPLPFLHGLIPWDNLQVLTDSIMKSSPRKSSLSLKIQHKLDNLPNCQLGLQVIHEVSQLLNGLWLHMRQKLWRNSNQFLHLSTTFLLALKKIKGIFCLIISRK